MQDLVAEYQQYQEATYVSFSSHSLFHHSHISFSNSVLSCSVEEEGEYEDGPPDESAQYEEN